MFYEYAFDPEILADRSLCSIFFESLRSSPSRLIADVPSRKWAREASFAINSIPNEVCGANQKNMLKKELKRLVDKNLISNRPNNADLLPSSWLELVTFENECYPFSGVLSDESREEPLKVYGLNQLVFDGPSMWNCDGQDHIDRKGREIIRTMEPLLRLSRTINLVDRYFSFTRPSWDAYEPLLKEMVQRLDAYNYGRGIKSIFIHTTANYGSQEDILKDRIKGWLPEGVVLKVRHWPHKTMHDRFLLTDIGGIEFGHGLGELDLENASKLRFTVLSSSVYKEERRKISGTPEIAYDVSSLE